MTTRHKPASLALAERLAEAGIAVPAGTFPETAHRKSARSWSWLLRDPKTLEYIAASSHTMTEVIKAKEWTITERIHPIHGNTFKVIDIKEEKPA